MTVDLLFLPAAVHQATHVTVRDRRRTRYIVPRPAGPRRASLAFFVAPQKRALLTAQDMLRPMWGAVDRRYLVEAELLRRLRDLAGVRAEHVALSLGSPGPHAKDTLALLGPWGTPVAVVKIASTAAAAALLEHERAWLDRLQGDPVLRQHAPRVLAHGSIEGCRLLAQTAVRGDFMDECPSSGVLEVLAHLQQAGSGGVFAESAMRAAIRSRLEKLRPRLAPDWLQRVELACELVEGELARVETVPAHRDFVHWNMRGCGERVVVFDWEHASDGYLPLTDLYHFLLMPHALTRPLSAEDARGTVATASRLLPSACKPTWQLLAYLLDLSLAFLEADQGEVRSAAVRHYGQLIDDFPHWRLS